MLPGKDEWTVIFLEGPYCLGQLHLRSNPGRAQDYGEASTLADVRGTDLYLRRCETRFRVAMLRWEKLAVPFKIGVNVHEMVRGRACPTNSRPVGKRNPARVVPPRAEQDFD